MKTISELTGRPIKPPRPDRSEEKVTILSSPIPRGNKTARHAVYEVEVFNFLLRNRGVLGIESVMKFTNLRVDGEIVLSGGKRLVIEVKLRMNWLKACQSVWQFRQFLKMTKEAMTNPVDGAIVFFEEFSGDWNKKKNRKAENVWGWEAWYLDYQDAVPGKRMDLVMLRNGKLQGYPD
jgi:hypothetical protein